MVIAKKLKDRPQLLVQLSRTAKGLSMLKIESDDNILIGDARGEEHDACKGFSVGESVFRFRIADTPEGRGAAGSLVNTMYSRKGYGSDHGVPDALETVTFLSECEGSLVGTISLTADSEQGLLADSTFRDAIDVFREGGRKVCEITKFAFQTEKSSKRALAALFNVLYIRARFGYGASDAFIEVNPRHRRFYEAMLEFQMIGEVRTNGRVKAPACLLHLDLTEVENIIRLRSHEVAASRSLYSMFFNSIEQEAVINRMKAHLNA